MKSIFQTHLQACTQHIYDWTLINTNTVNKHTICIYTYNLKLMQRAYAYIYARSHARTHTYTHARTHARTHTRTHSKDFTLYSHVYYYLRSIRLLCILHRTILHLKAPDCLSCMHTFNTSHSIRSSILHFVCLIINYCSWKRHLNKLIRATSSCRLPQSKYLNTYTCLAMLCLLLYLTRLPSSYSCS